MPAKNELMSIEPGAWVLVTDGAVDGAVMFQNRSGYSLMFQATADASAPEVDAGSAEYRPGQGERGDLADLFPGVVGANRLWAFAWAGGFVAIQHG